MNRHSRLVLSLWSVCFAYQLMPQGEAFLTPAIAADPALALANQAMMLYQANSVDEAQKYASMAIQANPNLAEAHYVKGLIAYHKHHQLEEGKAEFDKAIYLKNYR